MLFPFMGHFAAIAERAASLPEMHMIMMMMMQTGVRSKSFGCVCAFQVPATYFLCNHPSIYPVHHHTRTHIEGKRSSAWRGLVAQRAGFFLCFGFLVY